MATIDRIKSAFNPGLTVEGVVLTVDGRNSLPTKWPTKCAATSAFSRGDPAERASLRGAFPRHARAFVRCSVARSAGVFDLARELLDGLQVRRSRATPRSRACRRERTARTPAGCEPACEAARAAQRQGMLERSEPLGRGLDALLPARRAH